MKIISFIFGFLLGFLIGWYYVGEDIASECRMTSEFNIGDLKFECTMVNGSIFQ
jgi:hypothetical protein